jgi:signal transduction histidine kinase
MDRQLDHLVRLIDDLPDVSRVSQGKIELRREKIRVADVVQSAGEARRPTIDAARQAFEVDLSRGEELWIDGDATRLSQVISNLLNNAAKYTPSQGPINLSVLSNAGDAVIAVCDNGVGIPADMHSHVFRVFAQIGDHRERFPGRG